MTWLNERVVITKNSLMFHSLVRLMRGGEEVLSRRENHTVIGNIMIRVDNCLPNSTSVKANEKVPMLVFIPTEMYGGKAIIKTIKGMGFGSIIGMEDSYNPKVILRTIKRWVIG